MTRDLLLVSVVRGSPTEPVTENNKLKTMVVLSSSSSPPKRAKLVLADGSAFAGWAFGAEASVAGEVGEREIGSARVLMMELRNVCYAYYARL